MRLKDDMNTPMSAFSRSGQRGANFSGMMTVVIDYGNALCLPALLKPPVDSAINASGPRRSSPAQLQVGARSRLLLSHSARCAAPAHAVQMVQAVHRSVTRKREKSSAGLRSQKLEPIIGLSAIRHK